MELERLRARLVAGVTVAAPLLSAAKLGAAIHARLEAQVPEQWPALLVVHRDEAGRGSLAAPGACGRQRLVPSRLAWRKRACGSRTEV
jgi:hypothetical protein